MCGKFRTQFGSCKTAEQKRKRIVLIIIGKQCTYSSATKNLSPSDATHLPRKLSVDPLMKTGCWMPLRNHEPSQRDGNVQLAASDRNVFFLLKF